MFQSQQFVSDPIKLYNKKYSTTTEVENLNCGYLQRAIFKEISSKKIFEPDERIISHIFEHKDIDNSRYLEYNLRQYTNAYLTNYGNILICKSNFGEYPMINEKSLTKQLIYNKRLPDLYIKRMFKENWNCTHTSKLKKKFELLLEECHKWSTLV